MEKKKGRPTGTGKYQILFDECQSWRARALDAENKLHDAELQFRIKLSTTERDRYTAIAEAKRATVKMQILQQAFVSTINTIAAA